MTSSPFQIRDFWSVATPGATLCLLDGVYRGSRSMIAPPVGFRGTSSGPIAVRALNDGKVLIDGQFTHIPIRLEGNHWITVEGVNARHGTHGLVRHYKSSNITIRRVVVWDNDMYSFPGGTPGFLAADSSNVLWEDVAAFGAGGSRFHHQGSSGDFVTCRRCWGRWEGEVAGGDSDNAVFHLNYGGTFGFTCENCLATRSGESMPESYTTPDGRRFTGFRLHRTPGPLMRVRGGNDPGAINLRVLGSLAYIKSSDVLRHDGVQVGPVYIIRAPGANGFNFSDAQFRHVAVAISPSNDGFNTTRGFAFGPHTQAPSGLVMSNTTSIRGSLGDTINSVWTGSGRSSGTSLAAVPSPWTATSAGANLCYRWVNRQVTTTPLWPWPMNDRIKAATEMAGAYSGPCPTCVGGRARRRATDVTADVDALLGPIASRCQG